MHLELNSKLQAIEAHLLNFTGVLDVLANVILIYLILAKSSIMQSFRFYLLALQLVTLATDLFLTFLMKPIPIFPIIGGYTTGILFTYFGVSSHLQMTIVMALMANQEYIISVAFAEKHQTIASIDGKRIVKNWIRRLLDIICYFLLVVAVLSFYLSDISRHSEIDYIKRNVPVLLEPLSQLRSLEIYDSSVNPTIFFSLIILLTCNAFVIFFVLGLSIDIVRILKRHKAGVSAQNMKKHKAVFRALFAQFSVLGFCLLPVTVVLVFLIFEVPDIQVLSAAMVCIFSFHSFLGSIVMMITYQPYRKTILECFQKPKRSISVTESRVHKS